jgi:hypothetical protein
MWYFVDAFVGSKLSKPVVQHELLDNFFIRSLDMLLHPLLQNWQITDGLSLPVVFELAVIEYHCWIITSTSSDRGRQ